MAVGTDRLLILSS